MIHSLTYSIISHLKSQVAELTDVVWIFDGVTLTNRVKPFGTVEQMMPTTSRLAKERDLYATTYRFQIGLHAKTIAQRSQVQERMHQALLAADIALLDTSQPLPPPTVGFFYCDVNSITPIPVEDVNDETNKHRLYFDVEVYVERKTGGEQFEQ